MLPSASVLASRQEERVQKAVAVVHHGPGDARLSGVLNALSGPECDYVYSCYYRYYYYYYYYYYCLSRNVLGASWIPNGTRTRDIR